VAGNVPLDVGTTNVFRLLDLRRPSAAPLVAAGTARPLARELETAARYHGEDGLGELSDWPPVEPRLASRDAAHAIVDAAQRHGADLTIVALGPLTNVAIAADLDDGLLRGVGRVVAMGGAVDVPGNVTADAEFNAYCDPEAFASVLAAGVRVDLVPLDATRQAILERAALDAARAKHPGPIAERVARFTERAFRVDLAAGKRGMVLHDPLAVGLALDPSLAEWEPVRLAIGPDGQTRRASGPPNARFARVVDAPRFLSLFLDRVCRGS
jgi:purine nucleosidase